MTDGQTFYFAAIAALFLAAILDEIWAWYRERRFWRHVENVLYDWEKEGL